MPVRTKSKETRTSCVLRRCLNGKYKFMAENCTCTEDTACVNLKLNGFQLPCVMWALCTIISLTCRTIHCYDVVVTSPHKPPRRSPLSSRDTACISLCTDRIVRASVHAITKNYDDGVCFNITAMLLVNFILFFICQTSKTRCTCIGTAPANR